MRKLEKADNFSNKVADLCCEMRIKKNNEKTVIRQQIEQESLVYFRSDEKTKWKGIEAIQKYEKPSEREVSQNYEEEAKGNYRGDLARNIVISEEFKDALRDKVTFRKKCYTCGYNFKKLHFFYD